MAGDGGRQGGAIHRGGAEQSHRWPGLRLGAPERPKPEAVKAAHRERMLSYPKKDDPEMQARLKLRKEQAGMAQRDDIRSFVDFIDADEKRI